MEKSDDQSKILSKEKKRNLSLYDLAEEVVALEHLFLEEQGELTPELQELHASVDAILEAKTDSYVGFAWQLEDDIKIARARQKELTSFINARQQAIERLKSYVGYYFQSTGRDFIDGTLCTIAKRAGVKKLLIQDEDQVPVDFLKTTVTIDTRGLVAALKEGLALPDGIVLREGEPTIQFKKKPINRAKRKKEGNNE